MMNVEIKNNFLKREKYQTKNINKININETPKCILQRRKLNKSFLKPEILQITS